MDSPSVFARMSARGKLVEDFENTERRTLDGFEATFADFFVKVKCLMSEKHAALQAAEMHKAAL